ncbi:MAG: AAA family ATPase, partial [Niameybacter sp.]
MKTIPRLMLAGTASGTGKTTITCAILKHFHNQNKKVVAFKCGPDYIDTMFHKEVLKTPSYNLDLFMMGKEVCNHLLVKHAKDADFSLIEGVMGFYDGISDTTEASSYALAFGTKTPVVLVVSCKGMGLSIVPLLQGYLNYKKNSIKGVILNDISQMTYDYYKKMIEAQTNLRVYGFMPHIEACRLESRHLGLITAKEVEAIESKIEKLGEEA